MNVNRIVGLAALSLAVGFCASGVAQADSGIGDLAAGGYVQEFGNYGTIASHALYAPGSTSIGSASLDIEAAPGGAILAKTPVSTTAGSFYVEGTESYYAELLGPTASAVPLRLYFKLSTSSTGPSSYGSAGVTFDKTFYDQVSRNGEVTPKADSYLLQYESTDSPFKITLGASSEFGGVGYVDPMLEVDSTWAAANPALASQLSLSFSGGVDNGFGDLSASVPEPASWAMMLTGFGLAGAAVRRRASRSRFAAP